MTIKINEEFAYYVHKRVIPNALELLPGRMTSAESRAELLAIALQESRCSERTQIGGPARGFWQFERAGGVRGVLRHASTRPIVLPILAFMNYDDASEATCYYAIAHNDVLAAVFARLLLWTVPGKLATHDEEDKAWDQYVEGWRPGKPHRDTWHDCYDIAWRHVFNE